VVRNVNASLVNGHSAAARVLTVWQSNNVQATGIRADTPADKAVFFIESWARNTTLSDIDVKWRYADAPRNAVVHFTGGSTGTYVDRLRVDNTGPVMLLGQGGQQAQVRFGSVVIRRGVKSVPLHVVNDLTVGSQRYASPVRVVRTIDLQGAWNNRRFDLAAGTIKSIKFTLSHAGAVSGLFLVNAQGVGGEFSRSLVGGQTVDLSGQACGIGTDFPFNDALDSMKSIGLITPAVIPAGARLTVEMEVFPKAFA
jgi:hypothetical protein